MKETAAGSRYNQKLYCIEKTILEITIQIRLCIFAATPPRAADSGVRHGNSMADQSTSGESGNHTVVANYVATMSADLATMARRSGLDTLGYLLEMVRLEAENVTRHKQNGGQS